MEAQIKALTTRVVPIEKPPPSARPQQPQESETLATLTTEVETLKERITRIIGATHKASSACPGGYSLHNIFNRVEAQRKRLTNLEDIQGGSALVKKVQSQLHTNVQDPPPATTTD